jgi:hypothetical protein
VVTPADAVAKAPTTWDRALRTAPDPWRLRRVHAELGLLNESRRRRRLATALLEFSTVRMPARMQRQMEKTSLFFNCVGHTRLAAAAGRLRSDGCLQPSPWR